MLLSTLRFRACFHPTVSTPTHAEEGEGGGGLLTRNLPRLAWHAAQSFSIVSLEVGIRGSLHPPHTASPCQCRLDRMVSRNKRKQKNTTQRSAAWHWPTGIPSRHVPSISTIDCLDCRIPPLVSSGRAHGSVHLACSQPIPLTPLSVLTSHTCSSVHYVGILTVF